MRHSYRLRRKLAFATLAVAVGSSLAVPKVSALSWSSDCTASKTIALFPGYIVIWTGTHAQLNGYASGGSRVLQTVSYTMGSPWWQGIVPPGPPLPWLDGTGSSNNINFVSPISLNSPDSLGWGGTWNFPDFSVASNTVVKMTMIPDFSNHPDPSCTMSVTVG